MATKTTHSTVDPPIPLEAIAELEEVLGRSLSGWEDKEPRWHSPSPATLVDDAWFDVMAVNKVVRALRRMPHTKGRQWAKTPFEPATWQIVWLIAPVFGWKHLGDGTRIVREVWDEIPRKNGKSTISARLGLVLAAADGEWGGEVYAAATSRDQARVVLDQAREVALRSPTLRRRCEPLADVIRFPRTGTVFRALSRAADAAHGLNVSGAVVDEVHLHRNRGLIVAIESGTGAREQPLIIYITTAGDDDDTTIYAEKHNYAIKIGEGKHTDATVWVVIWAADEDDDYLAEETWAKANPNYPISPTPAFLQREFSQLAEKPQKLGELLRLHLNIRHGIAEGIWTGAEAWADHAYLRVDESELAGQPAWGGLVGASATELAALCWTFPAPDGAGYRSIWRYFLPKDRLEEFNRRSGGRAESWVSEGRLRVTEGSQLSIAEIIDVVDRDIRTFEFRELAVDRSNAIGFTQKLEELEILDFDSQVAVIHPNTPGSCLVDWETMLRGGTYDHGSDPITTWQISHTKQRVTEAGVRIDRKGSVENVYGVVAGEMALRRALVAIEPATSAYEGIEDDEDFIVTA